MPEARPLILALLVSLAGCGDSYTPDTYATRAVQQANKVEQGIIVGVRRVNISAEGSTGAATGAAAGAVVGAQAPGGSLTAALGGVGGALVGGLFGKAAESVAVDAPAFEYVVQTRRGELISVTQREDKALVVGQKILVIAGTQARVDLYPGRAFYVESTRFDPAWRWWQRHIGDRAARSINDRILALEDV